MLSSFSGGKAVVFGDGLILQYGKYLNAKNLKHFQSLVSLSSDHLWNLVMVIIMVRKKRRQKGPIILFSLLCTKTGDDICHVARVMSCGCRG